ncbi:Ras and EF-hand domain-containing protein [Schistosoma japonicum]|uniref:Ras and EF-hand domain-containing protein n=1 Tax=Schistosoma japonicum TaxID=6182 RepID=A0A4Z2CWD1_SCHJA|nr:Ras and EF-hand domain-containing protein [Schistosoma japonicum]
MTECNTDMIEQARLLFMHCDTDDCGYLTRQALDRLSDRLPLTSSQLDFVFNLLDKDKNGQLTLDEFIQGFGHFIVDKAANNYLLDEEIDEQYNQIILSLDPENMLKSKIMKQDEELHNLVEELESQVNQEKEQLKQKEEIKERELKEELNNKVQEKEKLLSDLVQQFEKASIKVEELQKTRTSISQEKEKLLQEKEDLERKLEESQEMLNECKEYIDTLQKKAREERRRRAKAAIELSEGIALERETLVRQLDMLRTINQKLVDEQEFKSQTVYTIKEASQATDLRDFHNKSQSLDLTSAKNAGTTIKDTAALPHLLCSSTDLDATHFEMVTDARRGSTLSNYFTPVILNNENMREGDLENIDEGEEYEEVFSQYPTNIHTPSIRKTSQKSRTHMSGSTEVCFMPNGRRVSPDGASYMSSHADSTTNGTFAERVYKVIFVGDSGVGKSSIIRKFVSGVFDLNLPLTVAIDFHVKFMHCDGTNLYLQLWDTAGQEKFRSITRQYYRKSDGVIIVFDATNESSFLAVRSWLQSVTEETDENTVILILENKSDLIEENDDQRAVSKSTIDKIARAYKTMCFDVSAKTGHNIEEAFMAMARKLKEKEVYELQTLQNLKNDASTKKNTCCR